jgi:DNA excision repair protein ERCC-3
VATAANKPLIVQSDCSILLEVNAQHADAARAALAPFAELVKSPEHVHTYRLTPLSIWNARSTGMEAEQMVAALREHARYPVPPNVEREILELAARYGRVVITSDGNFLRCACQDQLTTQRIARATEASPYLTHPISPTAFRVAREARGVLKQALVAVGYPAADLAGSAGGASESGAA